jgi:hypothetical protein
MAQELRRLVGHFQDAVHLMGRNILLAAAHQVDGLEQLVERDMAFLEYRTHSHRELATAGGTLVEAMTLNAFRVLLGKLSAHARQPVMLPNGAAVGAVGAIPDNS